MPAQFSALPRPRVLSLAICIWRTCTAFDWPWERLLPRALEASELCQEEVSPHDGCPAVSFQAPWGSVHVEATKANSVIDVRCPSDYTYAGPELQCGWADRACIADSDGNMLRSRCWNIFNITLRGEGLVEWPDSVSPLLISKPPSCTSHGLAGKRDTARLPLPVQASALTCKKEAGVDISFGGVAVRRTATEREPWQIRYFRVGHTHDYRELDLVVTTLSGLQHSIPPGDSSKSGTRSATGILSVQRGSDVVLKFTFVETGTDTKVSLGRVVFSLFDLDLDDKEVTVSGVSEYFISRETSLRVANVGEGSYRFSRTHDAIRVSDASVLRIWQDSLRSMVSLKFRNTAEFTIRIKVPNEANTPVCHTAAKGEACYSDVLRAMASNVNMYAVDDRDHAFMRIQSQLHRERGDSLCPLPCAQLTSDDVTLEFAGWSEMADIGEKIVSRADGPADDK